MKVGQEVRSHLGCDVGAALDRAITPRTSSAPCYQVLAVVPIKAKIIGYRFQVHDQATGLHNCGPGKECASGYARFLGDPQTISSSPVQVVMATFQNWAHDLDRRGFMTIFFQMPDNEEPITQQM
jgi:hypothetical protein